MKPLTTARIAYNNLRGKPGRTAALIAIVLIMAFLLYGGAVLSQSLDNGLGSLEARLGADIAVVPLGSESAYENVMLTGAPADFYIDRSVKEQVAAIPGVAQITTQFYLTTFDSACCTVRVQIIGIDYDTDFVIMPWINRFHQYSLGDEEIIIGSDLRFGIDNRILFFGQFLSVAARLERTATGMDNTAFVNMTTARELARAAQESGRALEGVDIDNAVSTVLVRVEPNFDVAEVVSNIRRYIPDVGIVESYVIFSGIGTSLNFFAEMIRVISIALGIFAAAILAVLFSITASGRKKEFAVLRILGATRKKLASTVLTEAFMISLCGAIIGISLAAIVVFPFGRNIGLQIGMPLLLPSLQDSFILLVLSFVLSVAVGAVSSAYSAYKISRAETYATMRDGE